MKNLTITTQDATPIAASVFTPTHAIKGGVIINSATGVSRRYYQSFANFLCEQGYMVISYDYRGIGDSRTLPAREPSQTMMAWGEQDFNAVIAWAKENHGQLPWHCIGHSVGGQLVGLAELSHTLTSVYAVAAQSGNWRNWGFWKKPKLILSWYVLIPVLSRVLGYLPGAIFGGEALPEKVAMEWARWCKNPEFICNEKGQAVRPFFANITSKMQFIHLQDDHDFAPLKAVRQLHDFFLNADKSVESINPSQYGQKQIGHFGYFNKRNEGGLWTHATQWLEKAG